MAGTAGFEPATPRLTAERSAIELRANFYSNYIIAHKFLCVNLQIYLRVTCIYSVDEEGNF